MIVLKPGDHVLIKGPISKSEKQILERAAMNMGVFFIISKNPRVEFELLDDITLAHYGLRKFCRKGTSGRIGEIDPSPNNAA